MISVLIATYNRCQDLKMVLSCLQNQKIPFEHDYEVLIIDNNSSDDTKTMVESFIPVFQGRLRYLFEPRQGKPFAVNLGIKEARGTIIVLTDDDCTFDNDYLCKIHGAFEQNGPSIGFIGGKVLPRWVNCSRPSWFIDLKPGWWFKEFFWGPLAVLDYGDKPFVIDERQITAAETKFFYGANMSVRKEAFARCGVIDLKKHVTEDTELQLRFLKSGIKGLYAPHIEVYHKVSPERLTPQYYYRWYYLRGVLLGVETSFKNKFYHPFGVSWSLIAETINLWIGSILDLSLAERVYKRSHALFNLGQMAQIAKNNHSRKAS